MFLGLGYGGDGVAIGDAKMRGSATSFAVSLCCECLRVWKLCFLN